MKNITLNGFIQCKPADKYDNCNVIDGMLYEFWAYENMKSSGYAIVTPHTITVDMPDSFNPNVQFVEALEAQKKKITAEFQNRITEIERQISQFTAIECAA